MTHPDRITFGPETSLYVSNVHSFDHGSLTIGSGPSLTTSGTAGNPL
ncbi:MAG: hypothetical protein JWR35_1565 [Marmoricola sp.]|jgi:hypothetical protein|nr:hypothetical protein [Marmoricola sp.]